MPTRDARAGEAPSPELAAQAAEAAARGSLLFHLFLAEALAGDALAASAPEGVQGWAVDVGGDGYEVCALGGAGGGEVVRRVTFAADGAPLVEAPGVEASLRLRRLAAAREAASEAACAHPHRRAALVVPPPRDGRDARELQAYLVRLPDRAGEIVLGPHWRMRVDEDGAVGAAILDCGADQVLTEAQARARAGLRLIHAEGPVPSPLHVFMSLQHGLALEVSTPASGLHWRVEGETVALA